MKKILIVEDNSEYVRFWTMAVLRKYPECTILSFSTPQEALVGIAKNLDFDILLLDGELANWTHGREVLKTLTEEQVKKTAICSANRDFIAEAKTKGVTFQLEKEPDWVEASELFTYIVETLEQIHSAK